MKANQKGFGAVEILIVIVAVGLVGGAGWYVWQSKNKKQDTANTSQATPAKQEAPEKTDTYKSKLYPSLSFTLPDGWQVNEPATYDEDTWGAGSADSEIKITKGETTLVLMFSTLRATGFESYNCYDYKDLVKVADLYRFTDKDGVTAYSAGVSTSDEEWVRVIAEEFTNSEDSNPNFCVSYPFIATHKSTLNKKVYPDSPFNDVTTDINEILVWVSADVKGNVTKEILLDTDTIISSFSESVDW